MNIHLKFAVPILAIVLSMYFATYLAIFDNIATEVGYEYYAEPRDHDIPFIPSGLKMPMNCLVNIGYIIVGLVWIRNSRTKKPNQKDLILAYSWMSIAYGFVQFFRIFYQTHAFAVLDQWCTTPFFSFLVVWLQSLLENEPLTLRRVAFATTFSCCTYLLSLFYVYGFEIQLVGHIVFAVFYGVKLQVQKGNTETFRLLVAAVLFCFGFVVLKVFDEHLEMFPVSKRFSGHFWSKICDFMQIHAVLLFVDYFGSRQRQH